MSFPRYPAYKDSGVEWLGEVPFEWKVTPLKSIACVINGFPFDSKSFDTNEGFPLVRIRDLNRSSPDTRYKGEFVDSAAIGNDDVLIGMDGDFNVGRWLGEVPALLNQRVCCVRAGTPNITRYLQYLLPVPLDAINKLTYATTVKHLSSFDVLKIRLAMPPDESHIKEIVSFLDRETAKIDALIAEQQRLIELLQEKRQAVISHAVTKGLNPDAPMKDSGVEWLGDVPEHWTVLPLRLSAKIESGHTPSRSREDYWVPEECVVPWFSLGDVWQLREQKIEHVNTTNEKISQIGLDNSAARILPAGTVILSRTASVGFAGILSVPMATTQDFVNWICGPSLVPEFLLYVFRGMKQEFDRLKYGSTHNTIYMPDVYSFRVALPSLEEQKRIVLHVRETLLLLDESLSELQDSLNLLAERRASLISAAVTGQIDVRGYAPEAAVA